MHMPAMHRKINMYMLGAVSYVGSVSALYKRISDVDPWELNTMTELTQFFSSILVGCVP